MIRTAAFAALFSVAQPAFAQESQTLSQTDELFELLHLPEIVEIMREEGLSYGQTIGQDLFGGAPSAEWDGVVAQIYDYDRMISLVREDFELSLDGIDVGPMIDFFASDRGSMIVDLEVSARRALLDDAVTEASEEAAAIALADDDPRMEMVKAFVETNNIIETNVAGALNSNLAFYYGLLDGGAFGGALTEDQILSDVWSQEQEIRDNTTEWIYSFLFMAYTPLDEADLEAYIAFSGTETGADLNNAMFESFDRLFEGISRSLGRAAADEMTAQEL